MPELLERIEKALAGRARSVTRNALGEITIETDAVEVGPVCRSLRDEAELAFGQLIDLAGIDYSEYLEGRAGRPRFAVVYHLLSLRHNARVRVRAALEGEMPVIASVVDVWPNANWMEREAFDLFGIVFEGHPDLRRILTDYGFIGHPFRKDFPLIGEVEMHYDPERGRVVYAPVEIDPRVTVPRVRPRDHRYDGRSQGHGLSDLEQPDG